MSSTPSDALGEKLSKIRRDLDPPYTGKLVADQVIVFDHAQGSSLYAKGFYGKPLGIKKPDPKLAFDRELQLDMLEAVHLAKKGWLVVLDNKTEKPFTAAELEVIASEKYEKFKELGLVYDDLRAKGYVVRPGLKFGADFTVYREGPGIDHSAFVVLVLDHENRISSMDMVKAGRLATSVKKRFVIASISSGEKMLPSITYYVFRWFKP